ncbi:hypothetical protein Tco_0585670 [Tanacetum coccineum]
MRLEVRSVHPYVTEHPDSDSGKMEFMSLMKFSGYNSQLNSIHQFDGFMGSKPKDTIRKELAGKHLGSLKEDLAEMNSNTCNGFDLFKWQL